MNKIIKKAAAIVTALAVFVTMAVFDVPKTPTAEAAVTPTVSITTGTLKTYTNSKDASSTAYSSLTSTSGWTKSGTSGTNKYTVTLNEDSKNGNYTMGYVPITVSVNVPANTSYRTNVSFTITGSPNKSGGSGLNFVELFDFGTTDRSSSLTFSTAENTKSSNSYTAARDVRKTNDFTASYSVTLVFENTASSDKTVSHYFGLFASGMKATTYKHQVKTTCTINYGKLVDDATVSPQISYSSGDARYNLHYTLKDTYSKDQFYPNVPSTSLTYDDFEKMAYTGWSGGHLAEMRDVWEYDKFEFSSNGVNNLYFTAVGHNTYETSTGKLAYIPFTVPIKVPAYTERTYYLTFEISYNRGTGSGAGFFAELIEGGVPSSFNTAASASMTGNTKLRVYSDDGGKTKIFSGTVEVPLTLKNDTDSAKTMYGNYVFFAGFRRTGAYNPEPTFNLTLTDIGFASYEDDHYAEINASNCTYTHNQTITPGSDYNATITANTGYSLPSTITVKCGGTTMATSKYTWNSSTGKLSIASKNITGGIVVTANGVANKYNITYSGLDGATLTTKPTTHTYGTATTVGDPTKTGYTFAGWKVNGGSSATKSLSLGATSYTANITLEATWTINKYNATFSGTNTAQSSGFGTNAVTYNTAWTGKFTANTGYDLPSSITVKVDGTTLATTKYTYSKSGSTGTVTISAANVTGAVAVTAGGTAKSYNITYSGLDGATLTTKPTTHTYGTATTVGNPTKTGYTFAGWKINGGSTTYKTLSLGATAYTADITLEATWTALKYNATLSGTNVSTSSGFGTSTVTYNTAWTGKFTANTGYNLPSSVTVKVGTTTLTTSQYTYSTSGSTGTVTITAANVTGAVAVTANGTAKKYKATLSGSNVSTSSGFGTSAVTYNTAWTGKFTANTGYTLPTSVTVTVNGTTLTSGYTYTRSGSTGTVTITAANVTGAVTVTASPTANSYTITYNLDGGSIVSTKPTKHTYGTATTIPDPTKTGYTFEGWKVNSGTTATKSLTLGATDYTANITLTATWTINTYSATLSGSNITASSGFGTGAATYKTTWTGTLTAASGYVLPESITVKVGSTTLTTAKYTYSKSTGKVSVTSTYVTGNITVTADGHQHSYTSEVTTEATCTATGVRTYKCSSCSSGYTETIPKTGHSYSDEWTTSSGSSYHWHACTECGTAGTKYSHVWNDGDVTIEATIVSPGEKTFTCTACSATKTEPIPMLDHTEHNISDEEGEWSGSDDDEHWHVCDDGCGERVDHEAHTLRETGEHEDPTCTEQGYTVYVCEVCSNKVTKRIDPTGHEFDDEWESDGTNHFHVCTLCHTEISGTEAHKWDRGSVEKNPDCTNTGVCVYRCTVCGRLHNEELDIVDDAHDWGDWEMIIKPTMEGTGTIQSVCTINPDHIMTDEIPSLTDTDFWKLADSTEPTCTEDGADIYECEYGQVTVPTESAKGHSPIADERVEPTCASTGLTAGSHCDVCGEALEEREVLDELGHDWDKDNGEITTSPACTEKGSITYSCKRCDATYTEDIPETGHTEVTDSVVAATCTETGLTEGKHCSECDAVIVEQEVIKALGHDWIDGKVTKEPSCTEDGVKTFSCTRCDETKTEVIEAVGHTEVTDNAVAATCTESGKTAGSHCSVCGKIIKPQENIPALGHSWDDGVVTVPPEEDMAGLRTYTCTVCGEEKTEPIAPLNHTHDWDTDWSNDDTYHWHDCLNNCGEKKDEAAHIWNDGKVTKQPAESDEGEKTFECTVCGITRTETIPATGGSTTQDNPDNPDNPENPNNPNNPNKPNNPDNPNPPSDPDDPNKPDKPDDKPDATDNGNISKEVQPGENVPDTKLETPLDELVDAVLTPDEQEITKDGVDIKIVLTVDDATDNVSVADKTAIEKKIGNLTDYKLGQYLDVNLLKIIGESQEKITETDVPITVMFEVPEALRGDKRQYSVIRVHDGETTVLSDLDSDPDTVTIKTDKFSTYALTYHEDTTSSKPSGGNTSSSGGSGSRPGHSTPNTPTDNDNSDNNSSDTTSSGSGTSSGDNGSDSNGSDTTLSGNDTSSVESHLSTEDSNSDGSNSDTISSGDDTSSVNESLSTEDSSSDDGNSDTTSSESGTSSVDSNPSTEDSSPDGNSSDTTSSGGVPTSDETTNYPSEGSRSENNDNPATGIAASLVPLAAAVTVLTVSAKRKKK